MTPEQAESWMLYFDLVGAPPERDIAEIKLDRIDLTFGNLSTMKSRLGYSVRDFLYYKKRSGNNVATLVEVETELDASGMITMNEEEKEVRLVLTRDKITELNVSITPVKLPPGTAFYEDFTDEPIDEYKDWIAELHEAGVGRGKLTCCTLSIPASYFIGSQFNNISMVAEYKDTLREDTVKTYSAWLQLEGRFDDIGNIISLHVVSQFNGSSNTIFNLCCIV